MQEIFIKIINTVDKFKDSLSQFDTWVYSTARSTVLNFIRTKKRYEARIWLLESIYSLVEDGYKYRKQNENIK